MASPRALHYRFAGAWIGASLFVVALAMAATVAHGPLALALERVVSAWQNAFATVIGTPGALAGWRLYAVAFGGGLVASLSPCILGMLPVNLSYVGASRIQSRRRAALVAAMFVGGVATINALLGLFSALFFAIFVEYRPYVNIVVGILTIVMGLWMVGAIAVRLPNLAKMPRDAGPFLTGAAFALVASPCASPVLVTVLTAAAKEGSLVHTALAMGFYSVGYTAVLLGITFASRRLLAHGELLTRIGATALMLYGAGTIVYGATLLR